MTTMRLLAGAASDTGRVRAHNEDVYAIRPAQGLFVVCDGMGGAAAGEVASDLAAKAIVADLARVKRPLQGAAPQPAPGDHGCLPQTARLAEAVRRSNRAVYEQARRDPRCAGMGTTVVGAWVAHHVASVAHVGDSRAYLWRHGELLPLTRDHSLVEAQVDAGLLDRAAASGAEHQNVLLRVLGREPDVEVELNEVPVRPGDYLLLCSDGLTRMVPDDMLARAMVQLRSPQRMCEALVRLANESGGNDNVTVVAVRVAEHWWERFAAGWERGRRGLNGETYPAV